MADEPATNTTAAQSQPSAVPLGGSVIPLVNKLQDIFAQLGSQSTIELPQVAVVGSQSSGKSSVLEALVGRDFLPRGNDICTRRPLVLQLLQTKTDEEYGEFLHLPGKRFYDFSEIRREIQAQTDKEAGGNKGVSDKQIRLKIFSPHVLDITLVDLPGITKVPVGEQPADIEARIRTMIMSYIKQPSCLILAVTPANSDLANSDALQIAGIADPDGNICVHYPFWLDIMDRGTDARNLLLGKVIPLRLGYVGVVNRSQEDIMFNRSIKDALVAEEKFFRSRPVYNGLADRCGVPQLAKKLNQILVQHIKAILPGLKSRISSALVSVAKEHASYGEITESKASFSSMVEGKNEEMSTSELSGGARIHYIFQSIFVKSLEQRLRGNVCASHGPMVSKMENPIQKVVVPFKRALRHGRVEVDPCEDLTDDDIRTAIQNATGPKSALFVPDVPFEVLIRRQIARLLDPSLQCARFIYDELMKISHHCLVNELQRFPVLRKRMDEVIGNFLREGLEPSETMIGHIIEMEMDYINTSHPNFIGGSKAVEIALQQIKSSKVPLPITRHKDGVEPDKAPSSERSLKSRAILARQGVRPTVEVEKVAPAGNTSGSSWGISSIFGGSDNRVSAGKESVTNKPFSEPVQNMEHAFAMIHLREPPTILRPSESHSEQENVEIAVTKLLLRSYYDIVRKNIEDSIPKAVMHFLIVANFAGTLRGFVNNHHMCKSQTVGWCGKGPLDSAKGSGVKIPLDPPKVNHTKRELHNVFIKKLYRENLFEEMLQEPEEVAMKRKRTRDTLRVLQQAFRTLDELPLEADSVERGYNMSADPTGLPKIHGLPTSSMYTTSSGSNDSYTASPKNPKSRKSSHSGELQSHLFSNADSNGSGRSGKNNKEQSIPYFCQRASTVGGISEPVPQSRLEVPARTGRHMFFQQMRLSCNSNWRANPVKPLKLDSITSGVNTLLVKAHMLFAHGSSAHGSSARGFSAHGLSAHGSSAHGLSAHRKSAHGAN
ncbi:Dynamin-related protein 3A [Citrus sinensis]|uniref:Dynamin-related protein 3A n=1 Tax=Citrus sinensis TaxID=2711 RepID=A0ACB8IJA4_CITSI|nr:Dynamin-related protein 3A [Citrus sinensis]